MGATPVGLHRLCIVSQLCGYRRPGASRGGGGGMCRFGCRVNVVGAWGVGHGRARPPVVGTPNAVLPGALRPDAQRHGNALHGTPVKMPSRGCGGGGGHETLHAGASPQPDTRARTLTRVPRGPTGNGLRPPLAPSGTSAQRQVLVLPFGGHPQHRISCGGDALAGVGWGASLRQA